MFGTHLEQNMGMNSWAREKVLYPEWEVSREVVKIYPDGTREVKTVKSTRSYSDGAPIVATLLGAHHEEVGFLSKYERWGGYEQFVQKVMFPESELPIYFLALKDADGNVVPESLWDQKLMVKKANRLMNAFKKPVESLM